MAASDLAVNTYSYTFSHRMQEGLLHLKGLGFRSFEILATPPHLWPADLGRRERREIPRRLAGEGLSIVSINHPSLDHNLVSPVPEMRAYTVDKFRLLIELAGAWAVPYVVVVPGKASPLFPASRPWLEEWFVDGMRRLAGAAAEAGVGLLVENVPIAWLPKAADVAAMLDRLDDARVGVCYDVANAFYAGENPAAGVRRVKDRLRLVHLSDTGRRRWRHDPVGQGSVDFAAFAKALKEIGYGGPSVMEIVSETPDRDLAESARRLAKLGWGEPRATASPGARPAAARPRSGAPTRPPSRGRSAG